MKPNSYSTKAGEGSPTYFFHKKEKGTIYKYPTQDKDTLDKIIMEIVNRHIDITTPDWYDNTSQQTWHNVFSELEATLGYYHFFFGWASIVDGSFKKEDFKEGVGINDCNSSRSKTIWFYEIESGTEKNLKRLKIIDRSLNETVQRS